MDTGSGPRANIYLRGWFPVGMTSIILIALCLHFSGGDTPWDDNRL